MVNTFFDEIHKLSDHFSFNFVESLKQELDIILQVISLHASEASTFFTLLTMLLRRLSPIEGAFANTLILTKTIISKLNGDNNNQAVASQFNNFFEKHLFRSYCALIKECPNKR
jgi:hypothetical protein